MSARSVTDLSITYADGARLHTKVTMMSAEAKLALARELVAAAGYAVVMVEPSANALIAMAKVRYESPRTIYGAMLAAAAKEPQE